MEAACIPSAEVTYLLSQRRMPFSLPLKRGLLTLSFRIAARLFHIPL
jgi:hypothetical protein